MAAFDEQLTIELGQGASYTYSGRPRNDLPLTFSEGTLTLNFCYYESNGKTFKIALYRLDNHKWYINLTVKRRRMNTYIICQLK